MSNKIEEVADDEIPALEEVPAAAQGPSKAGGAPTVPVEPMNRNEKKVRKAFEKLKLEPVLGYNRITMIKQRNCMAIKNPDVFKGKGNSYVIFGEIKQEDNSRLRAQQKMMEANALEAEIMAQERAEEAAAGGGDEDVEEIETGEVDDTGINAKDIELIMNQANTSRAKAIKALRACDNDVVNAIMELSSQ